MTLPMFSTLFSPPPLATIILMKRLINEETSPLHKKGHFILAVLGLPSEKNSSNYAFSVLLLLSYIF